MSTYHDAKRMLASRDKMLRDAYHGRNGLSMSESQRTEYRAMMERVKAARRISRAN